MIPGSDGKPVGRLHVDVQPAIRTSDKRPMYLFHLTARGQIGESFEFFDLGRPLDRQIVRGAHKS